MATPKERPKIKPQNSRTVICQVCTAEYNPHLSWVRGWRYRDATDGAFHPSFDIPKGKCPICLTPQEPASD